MVVSRTDWYVVGKAAMGDKGAGMGSDTGLTSFSAESVSSRIRDFAGLLLAYKVREDGEASGGAILDSRQCKEISVFLIYNIFFCVSG